jgi:hypothetical protein
MRGTQSPPPSMTIASWSIAVALRRSARAPCTRRTSPANLRWVPLSAPRAFRVQPRRAAACDKSPTEAYFVSPVTRPGSRVVTSCSRQPLPSRVIESRERAVTAIIGLRPADTTTCPSGWNCPRRPGMEHLADRNPAIGEFVARSLDVRDNRMETVGGTGSGRRQSPSRRLQPAPCLEGLQRYQQTRLHRHPPTLLTSTPL